jgi:signal peptidase I
MLDDEATLDVLARTPPDIPAFSPWLEGVIRRGRILRRRRVAGRAVLGTALVAAIGAPLLLLSGLLKGPSVPTGDGHPVKLITYSMPSEAMEPTVKIGGVVLVDTNAYRFGGAPQLGDIVLFEWHTDGQTFKLLKRVIGLPGQTVDIHRGGVVFVDGRPLVEPYLNHTRDSRAFGPILVEPGHLFVLGDNRINSNDSRFAVGPVPMTNVIGKVVGFAGPGAGGTQGPLP